uniref:Hexosyltransferase n=1 Tax=Ornithorhynchus anatinus TaxID=9258 RepID=A0A6I8NMD4_ORNAN
MRRRVSPPGGGRGRHVRVRARARPALLLPLAALGGWALLGPGGWAEELLALWVSRGAGPAPAPGPGPAPLPPPPRLAGVPPGVPAPCGRRGAPFLLVLVSSAPAHRARREAIRATWGSRRRARGRRVRTLFLLGREGAAEALARRDVVAADFRDAYRNLTRKTLSGLAWAAARCPGARYVLKTDDDVYVNVGGLVDELLGRGAPRGDDPLTPGADRRRAPRGAAGRPPLYLGRVHWRVWPSREAGGRHEVSEALYPPGLGPFPPYASGTGYVLSAAAVRLVLAGAGAVPPLPLEDVFVGLSARRGGLAPAHCPRLAGAAHFPPDRCCHGRVLLTVHRVGPGEMARVWDLVRGPGPLCSPLQAALGLLRCRALAWLRG